MYTTRKDERRTPLTDSAKSARLYPTPGLEQYMEVCLVAHCWFPRQPEKPAPGIGWEAT